jgi:hypothetical protein
MSDFDRKKFVFHETFKNFNGKTSGSGFIGVILGLVGAISFLSAMVGYFLQIPNTIEIMGNILSLVAAATLLLGVRKVSGNFAKTDNKKDPLDPNNEQIVDMSKKG